MILEPAVPPAYPLSELREALAAARSGSQAARRQLVQWGVEPREQEEALAGAGERKAGA